MHPPPPPPPAGFLIADNPHDRCSLRFDLSSINLARQLVKAAPEDPNSDLAPWRTQLLESLHLKGANANLELQLGGANAVDARLVGALRVLLAPETMKEVAQGKSVAELCDASVEFDRAVDVAVTKTALGLCAIVLSHFPTKLEEDQTLLTASNTPNSTLSQVNQ